MSRFELKILFAVVFAAMIPGGAAMLLVNELAEESFQLGLNDRVREAVEETSKLYREVIAARVAAYKAFARELSESAELGRRAVAGREGISQYLHARMRAVEGVESVTLVHAHGKNIVVGAGRAFPDEAWHVRDIPNLEDEPLSVKAEALRGLGVTGLRIRAALERRYERRLEESGVFDAVYKEVAGQRSAFARSFALAFAGVLAIPVVVALGLGWLLARNVTKRVRAVIRGTGRVALGDLAFEIPIAGRDEVAELTRAFNAMVRDIREQREQIGYLERISAWQGVARRLAHEIKNPLTPIQLAIQEAARKYAGDDAKYRQLLDTSLEIVTEEVASLRKLVDEFSAFAKLPAVKAEETDLVAFLRDFVRDYGGIDDRVSVDLKVGVDSARVRLDRMLFRRVLDNLVKNAREAIVESGKGGNVTVEVLRRDEVVRLTVTDDGPGFTAQVRARLFEPYYTSKREGTGLGLAIVKKTILEHDGKIFAESGPEGGARFVIELRASS
ncbi:MAG: HAMP domain-containing protein [Deltaproteobacteria bacterium]|nr:HAMP domain-containing protein [Deltaproteobacteria bacterium]